MSSPPMYKSENTIGDILRDKVSQPMAPYITPKTENNYPAPRL